MELLLKKTHPILYAYKNKEDEVMEPLFTTVANDYVTFEDAKIKFKFLYYHKNIRWIKKDDVIRVVRKSKSYFIKALCNGEIISQDKKPDKKLLSQGYLAKFELIDVEEKEPGHYRNIPVRLRRKVKENYKKK